VWTNAAAATDQFYMQPCDTRPTAEGTWVSAEIVVKDQRCGAGMAYITATGACVDVDECDSDPCAGGGRSTCTNQRGSYTCACNSGWVGDGVTCTDVDECAGAAGVRNCGAHSLCINTAGSYNCTCAAGWCVAYISLVFRVALLNLHRLASALFGGSLRTLAG
jgi:hypothetical protein